MIRRLHGILIGYILKWSGTEWRFSKEYRWGTTPWKRFVYRCVDTVGANHIAGF